MIKLVVLTERAKKDLRAVPTQVLDKFEAWVQYVEAIGLEEVRKIPGFRRALSRASAKASVPYESTARIARSTS